MTEHTDYHAANLSLWEHWADLHMAGAYKVDEFIADPDSRPFDPLVLSLIGDVAGRRALHLQCHIGLDTIRLARLGADVTGIDFSPKAIAAATSIASQMGVSARFIEADVADLPAQVEPASFDVVFTSYGTIMWLPELKGWAHSIASRLSPGGVFHIIDVHPFLSVFDDYAEQPPLAVRYPYFSQEALHFIEQGSYVDREAPFSADSYAWQHTFEEIIGSLLEQGLVIEQFREFDRISWKALEFMVEGEHGLWHLPHGSGDIPLMFSLTARKTG